MSRVTDAINALIEQEKIDEQIFYFTHKFIGVKTREFSQDEIEENNLLLEKLRQESLRTVGEEIQKKQEEIWQKTIVQNLF